MSKKEYKSAEELMAKLQSDPELRARESEQEKRRAERDAPVLEEDRRLCQALASVGVSVDSVYDFADRQAAPPGTIPILVEWLTRAEQPRIREGIARALTSRDAGQDAARALIAAFESDSCRGLGNESVKWAIGNAISEAADASMLEDLIRLTLEKKHGSARQMIAIAVGKNARRDQAKRDQALEALLSVLDDPVIQGHALTGLRHLNDERARAAIEGFLDHAKAWIRKEAKHALTKLDKAASKR